MKEHMTLTRRSFLGTAAAAGAAAVVPARLFAADKPNSNFNGVQIGVNTYSYRGLPGSAEQTLGYLLENGLSSVELQGGVINGYIKPPSIKEDDPEASAKWLAAAEDKDILARCAALRKMYEDAGVKIHTSKFGNIGDGKMPDGQIEFCFCMAKALGSKIISREVDLNGNISKRLGALADKHKIYIAFHNHEQINAKTYDDPKILTSEYLAINFDIGHYVAANDDSVVAFIEKFSKRIVSLHLKDRTTKANGKKNLPFGEGDTPVVDVLNLLRKNKYPITADIELEYKIPEGSTPVKEVTTCVQYCKKALA
ncbi:MAG: sugar phosphate isomerase/epimerase [Kiritimatiellaeota bacterium]|nr:sugar phosphate isomerase/epimerase [Kiritimatiellota bacterium]